MTRLPPHSAQGWPESPGWQGPSHGDSGRDRPESGHVRVHSGGRSSLWWAGPHGYAEAACHPHAEPGGSGRAQTGVQTDRHAGHRCGRTDAGGPAGSSTGQGRQAGVSSWPEPSMSSSPASLSPDRPALGEKTPHLSSKRDRSPSAALRGFPPVGASWPLPIDPPTRAADEPRSEARSLPWPPGRHRAPHHTRVPTVSPGQVALTGPKLALHTSLQAPSFPKLRPVGGESWCHRGHFLGCPGVCCDISGCPRVSWGISWCPGVSQSVLGCARVSWGILGCLRVSWGVS